MGYKYKKNGIGRKRIDIDQKQFENLCAIHCTLNEIAGWFNCSEDTIENWCEDLYGERFSEVYKRFQGRGKVSLRRAQFRMAETNCSMAIWLGKQYLGQKDNVINSDNANGMLNDLIHYFKQAGDSNGKQE